MQKLEARGGGCCGYFQVCRHSGNCDLAPGQECGSQPWSYGVSVKPDWSPESPPAIGEAFCPLVAGPAACTYFFKDQRCESFNKRKTVNKLFIP